MGEESSWWKLIVWGRELRSGYLIPVWYGVSYRPWDQDVVICHLIPLNYIIGLTHKVVERLRRGPYTWQLDKVRKEIRTLEIHRDRLLLDSYRHEGNK